MQSPNPQFEDQYLCKGSYYLDKVDIIDWIRYFYVFKTVTRIRPAKTLEIGPGHGLMKKMLGDITAYSTMDVNMELRPDIIGDIRVFDRKLEAKFDCIIAAQVLEHIPFVDVEIACANLIRYLAPGGQAILTVPHRRSNFLFMSPRNRLRFWSVPTGFLSLGAFYRRFIKRKIWIDPHHCWELGDGTITVQRLEAVFGKVGFAKEMFKSLFYSDMWILKRVSV